MLRTRAQPLARRLVNSIAHGVRARPWSATSMLDTATIEEYTIKALTYEMELYQRKSAERTVPWFLSNMPSSYFKEITKDLQKDHLRALTALAETSMEQYVEDESQKLCEAAAKGDLTKIKQLIRHGAHPNVGDYDGRTPFHLAASEGKLDIIKYLGSVKGANINVVDRWGGTPLADALRHNHGEVISWLKAQGGLEKVDVQPSEERREKTPTKKSGSGMIELMLKSRNGQNVTFFRPHSETSTGSLQEIVDSLPLDDEIARVKGFVSKDQSLLCNVFEFGKAEYVQDSELDEHVARFNADAQKLKAGQMEGSITDWDPMFEEDSLREYLKCCPRSYLDNTPSYRAFMHMKMWEQTKGTDYGVFKVVKAFPDDGGEWWIYGCISNTHAHSELSRESKFLADNQLRVDRFHLDHIKDPHSGDKILVRFLVTPLFGATIDKEKIGKEMPRLKFLDNRVLDFASDCDINYTQAEVILSLGNMIFTVVNKELPYAYTLDRVMRIITDPENLKVVKKIADLFIGKFDPDNTVAAEEIASRTEEIRKEVNETVQGNANQHLMQRLVDAVHASLRTNLFLDNRMSLTVRVDPQLLMHDHPETPYGVFFCHSRGMNGFHCRFRDIARGGLRVVPTEGAERFGQEAVRHFDEVYGLSYAQQLKNKDIPEGGSKAVVMVNVSDRTPGARDFLIRKSVKCFTDGLLDLITPEEAAQARMVDYFGKPELLYLGPDENIIPDDIVWVTERAAVRHMKYPRAFMSSKPDAGINHKVYGVTSEGVAVFLRVALRNAGFDVDQDTFTIKMTGGPNGDVAGNMIKIARRDYQGRASFVGLVDHSGGVEDPNGLDLEELYRLHVEDRPIADYDASKLTSTGKKYGADTSDDIQMRNTMHNRLEADAFIPAGGRPNTININNYEKFFKEDGTPTAPLIVEAANIFTTPEARVELGKRGVLIVKDSSANKAGVMCSSYEIVASMILSGKEEFMDIKDELVEGVLALLREKARVEAELLFREYRAKPDVQLPAYSQLISDAINRASDAIIDCLNKNYDRLDAQTRHRLMVESLPKKLVEVADDRLETLPQAYIISMMGSSLGSKMVYNEGLNYIQSLSSDALADFATRYVHEEDRVREYMHEVEGSELKNKAAIMKILKTAGVRSVLAAGV